MRNFVFSLTCCLAYVAVVALVPASASGAIVDVGIPGFSFSPQNVTIDVGDTVRWTNSHTVSHTTTSNTLVWDSGSLGPGQQFQFTFTAPGVFPYHCSLHTVMMGTVTVEGCVLGATPNTISAASGGTVNFSLDGGTSHAGRNYLLLGSVSGTVPGTPLPGGLATLPLNLDPFTDLVLLLVNSPVFSNFLGILNAVGQGSAQLVSPPVDPMFIGVIMDYAWLVNNPFDCASNAVAISIGP